MLLADITDTSTVYACSSSGAFALNVHKTGFVLRIQSWKSGIETAGVCAGRKAMDAGHVFE